MASIFAEIREINNLKNEMEDYADAINECNRVIDVTLETLYGESGGKFAENLDKTAKSLLEFAKNLLDTLRSALKILGETAEKLSKADEEGASSLQNSKANR